MVGISSDSRTFRVSRVMPQQDFGELSRVVGDSNTRPCEIPKSRVDKQEVK